MSTSTGRTRRRRAAVTASLALLGVVTAACLGSDDTAGDDAAGSDVIEQSEIDAALAEPTTLTMWTWVSDIEDEVALFEAEYPAIDVEVVNAGQGAEQYDKLRTALTAGEGVPDVAQMEYQNIPSFTITEDLLDLRPYGAAALEDQFVDWTWTQVSGPEGQVYAYPMDTGPMGMLYREDIFAAAGIEPPATWEEFAEAARTLNESNPDVYLTNMPPNQGGDYLGLMWQAGARPFSAVEDGSITIALDDEPSLRVAEYWGELTAEGVVSTDPDFTDEWYQGLNNGRYATWLTAAWGPLFLSGQAPDTAGLWRAAPLPQWEEGEQVSGNWGGSTLAVMGDSANPIAAAELAKFINTDPESVALLTSQQFLFPAARSVLEDEEFIGQEVEFYGGQQVNQVFADIGETVDTEFVWSPFHGQVVSDYTETVGTAFAEKTDAAEGTRQWQERIVEYAETQGFTVASD